VRQSNPDLHSFLAEREKKSSATSLSSLLIKPVQRICKYPLLFAELLKQLKGMPANAAMSSYISELVGFFFSDHQKIWLTTLVFV